MSEVSRRDWLKSTALAAMLGGVDSEAAQHVHHEAAAEVARTGAYTAKVFSEHEWKTLDLLAEMVCPGARQGGAKEFIDLLASGNDGLASIFTGGLGWLDQECRRRHGAALLDAAEAQRAALLDRIAYRKNETPESAAGIRFFDWLRKLVFDAYYTSEAGIREIGYRGNGAMTEFAVPAGAIDYAIKRSPA